VRDECRVPEIEQSNKFLELIPVMEQFYFSNISSDRQGYMYLYLFMYIGI